MTIKSASLKTIGGFRKWRDIERAQVFIRQRELTERLATSMSQGFGKFSAVAVLTKFRTSYKNKLSTIEIVENDFIEYLYGIASEPAKGLLLAEEGDIISKLINSDDELCGVCYGSNESENPYNFGFTLVEIEQHFMMLGSLWKGVIKIETRRLEAGEYLGVFFTAI